MEELNLSEFYSKLREAHVLNKTEIKNEEEENLSINFLEASLETEIKIEEEEFPTDFLEASHTEFKTAEELNLSTDFLEGSLETEIKIEEEEFQTVFFLEGSLETEIKTDEEEFRKNLLEASLEVVKTEEEKFPTHLLETHPSIKIEEEIPTNIQHEFLNPTLRPYQENAVKWMLQREITPDYFTQDYFKVSSNEFSNIRIPSGGILADEMGLGKTVEILALILANKKKKRKWDEIEDVVPLKKFSRRVKFFCSCNNPENGKLIVCANCNKSQHRECVAKYRLDETQLYMCPTCWSNQKTLIESSATIIITPTAILRQWETEISKHINDKRFKVFIYNGITTTGWISPLELAEYDIILTDYNILRTEYNYLDTNSWKGRLRHEKKYIPLVSPLNFLRYWRVCLDEAQLVESTISNAAKMVKILPTVHRWAVTGTPMEQSFDDLYGLLFFLDCKPYTENRIWTSLTDPIRSNNDLNPLVNVLKKIMWRTCKSGVLDQINIPPQTEEIIYVTMSDVENFFYKGENSDCFEAFKKTMAKYKDEAKFLSGMSGKTKKVIMESLRMLRQDCTVSTKFTKITEKSYFGGSAFYTQKYTEKSLDPTELLKHLIGRNESECRTHLRKMIQCVNNIAGIHFINKEYKEAGEYYKTALKWVNDWSGTKIAVDNLPQIHTIHNLLEIYLMEDEMQEDEIEKLEQDLVKLESAFLKPFANLVNNCKIELLQVLHSINKVSAEMQPDNYWFRDVIYEQEDLKELTDSVASDDSDNSQDSNSSKDSEDDEKDDYFQKMQRYVETTFGKQVFQQPLTVQIVDHLLTTWFENIEDARNKMKIKFEKIKFFSENIKAKHELIQSDWEKVEKIVNSAFQCHLNPQTRNNPNKVLCDLCQIKQSMKFYETIIFSKTLNLDIEKENTGSWKPTHFEWMVKYIYNGCRLFDGISSRLFEGSLRMKYLTLLTKEYKTYSKFYVEVNHVAASFDDLRKCKARIQYEPKGQKFQSDYSEATKNFNSAEGGIKFLQHLNTTGRNTICKNCNRPTEKKYAFLLCGHIICPVCLVEFAKIDNSKIISCPCLKKTDFKDIFYCLNNDDEDDVPQIKGIYSSKVRAIVRNVLKLQNEDKNVKIIIFSHWDNILDTIAMALRENDIESAYKLGNPIKAIADFKNLNLESNCLLLPLAFGSKGLNLIEATHVFLVEPIMNPSEELQAVGRVHRIGQTKPTVVHRFIVKKTIEENIFNTISNATGLGQFKQITMEDLNNLFKIVDLDPYCIN